MRAMRKIVILISGRGSNMEAILRAAAAEQTLDHQHELVAAQARQGVFLAHLATQPLRHLLQELIAHGVAKGVVEVLEVVQIDEQQGAFLVAALVARQSLLQALLQQAAIGQAGERVVER